MSKNYDVTIISHAVDFPEYYLIWGPFLETPDNYPRAR